VAEMYPSSETLDFGDVVAPSTPSGYIRKADAAADKGRVIGIISTKPGLTIANIEDSDVPNYAVALAGRVPVKVTTENGAIHTGDHLILSTISGVAAKGVKAGVSIGIALEDYTGPGVGLVLAFVKNSYYSGSLTDDLPGVVSNGSLPTSREILLALVSSGITEANMKSEISTDKLIAGLEIITPKLTAGLIYADRIESPTLDNLTNQLTTSIDTLRNDVKITTDSLAARITALESASTTYTTSTTTADYILSVVSGIKEWVVDKVTAALGVFQRIEVGTVNVSQGIEMTDTATGGVYCLTIQNGDWNKTPGACGSVPAPTSLTPPDSGAPSTTDTTSAGDAVEEVASSTPSTP
jgi:hypothetical protein